MRQRCKSRVRYEGGTQKRNPLPQGYRCLIERWQDASAKRGFNPENNTGVRQQRKQKEEKRLPGGEGKKRGKTTGAELRQPNNPLTHETGEKPDPGRGDPELRLILKTQKSGAELKKGGELYK